jgi:hypothetical protein
MPIHFWTKELAILLTKKARYIWPAVIAAAGAVGGFLAGRWYKKGKGGKDERSQIA